MKFNFIIKWYILISILRFYTFRYNMLSIFYNLLSYIYHLIWLVIIIEYLSYFILSVFWFQISDLISSIHSYFKIIYEKNPLWTDSPLFWKCKWFVVTVTMAVNSPQPTLSFVILSCVFFYTHFDEDVNEIINCSHTGFGIWSDNIFTKEILTINTWVWALWYKA